MSVPYMFSVLFQFGNNVAFLILAALGLIIILGMMDIINLAHGEFMMIGAYIATIFCSLGVPFVLAIPISFIGCAIFGMFFERLALRKFYDRKLTAMVLTFGLSLILSQGALILFGPSMPSISIPLGSFRYGGFSYSVYRILLIFISLFLLFALWWLFNHTKPGLYARATMQNAETAKALGVDVSKIYMFTFAIGSGLVGAGGALLAPIMAIEPLMGSQLMAPAFITVVVGGAVEPIVGALGSSTLLSLIQTPTGRAYGAYVGRIALLLAALVIIRFFPTGVSGFIKNLKS